MAETPYDDDSTTTPAQAPSPTTGPSQLLCPVCWTPFTKIGRRRYCTDSCRKTAWTRRHTTEAMAKEDLEMLGFVSNVTKLWMHDPVSWDGTPGPETPRRTGRRADGH